MHHARQTLFLLAIAALGSCVTSTGEKIQPLPEAQPLRSHSGMITAQQLVIRDSGAWTALWPQLFAYGEQIPPVPEIDFASRVVVVAATGERNTGGYAIDVVDFDLAGSDATIVVLARSPGSQCAVTTALTAPLAVVLVPAFSGKATFVNQSSTIDC